MEKDLNFIDSTINKLNENRLYHFKSQNLSNVEGYKYKFYYQDRIATYKEFIYLLNSINIDIINQLNTILTKHSIAIFWECVPITKYEFDKKGFEFVVLPAYELNKRIVDIQPFNEYFTNNYKQESTIIAIDNIDKSSRLVIPCPNSKIIEQINTKELNMNDLQHMTHLNIFLKYSQENIKYDLWKKVSEEMLIRINNQSDDYKKIWLSTSGLGVSWLHIRLDSYPKYYNYQEYKS